MTALDALLRFPIQTVAGMRLIGSMIEDPMILAAILAGVHDEALLCAAFFKFHGKYVESEEDLKDPTSVFGVSHLKMRIRREIQFAIDDAEAREKETQVAARLEKMRERNSPSALGTTAEVAKKYGLSKAAVRKMRAEGTLDQLLAGDRASSLFDAPTDNV